MSNGSQSVFCKYEMSTKICNKFYVDIGASDGISDSTTYWMSQEGYSGIAIECTSNKFSRLCETQPNAIKVNKKITPDNVCSILEENNCPIEFGFLSLDIDSYDYWVLESLLQKYKPSIMCCEINEKIPPPIRFTVNYIHEAQWWEGNHLFGASIQMFTDFEKYGYKIVCVDYNNVYLSRVEGFEYVDVVTAYKNGYLNRSDRDIRYPWNRDVSEWLALPPNDVVDKITEWFGDRSGLYTVGIA